ncbi:MAG: type II toxin-antitoxin system MqsA family antitoxin [Pseudomonadota bacterium]
MKCVICKHGSTDAGMVSVTLVRGKTVVVFKEVPAQVCPNCGEYYLEVDVSKKLMERATSAVNAGTEVEIVRYAA